MKCVVLGWRTWKREILASYSTPPYPKGPPGCHFVVNSFSCHGECQLAASRWMLHLLITGHSKRLLYFFEKCSLLKCWEQSCFQAVIVTLFCSTLRVQQRMEANAGWKIKLSLSLLHAHGEKVTEGLRQVIFVFFFRVLSADLIPPRTPCSSSWPFNLLSPCSPMCYVKNQEACWI